MMGYVSAAESFLQGPADVLDHFDAPYISGRSWHSRGTSSLTPNWLGAKHLTWGEEQSAVPKIRKQAQFYRNIGMLSRKLLVDNAEDISTFDKAVTDALAFASKFPSQLRLPRLSVSTDGEIVMEWLSKTRRAIVGFEGDGFYGYAMFEDGSYIPGSECGNPNSEHLPADLLSCIEKI